MAECNYGCGTVGLYKAQKSKRWRCSARYQDCPAFKSANFGKTWEEIYGNDTSARRKAISEKATLRVRRPQTAAERKVTSDWAKKFGNGGFKPRSGRGRKGWYKGIFCASSWELAFVLWCLDHDKHIERNIETFQYVFGGQTRKYLPDFLVDGVLHEIKGYVSEQWKAKIHNFPKLLIVIGQQEIIPILDEIRLKYGKSFTELYEK